MAERIQLYEGETLTEAESRVIREFLRDELEEILFDGVWMHMDEYGNVGLTTMRDIERVIAKHFPEKWKKTDGLERR